jgi:polar amino acid transport system ATP-binding protein
VAEGEVVCVIGPSGSGKSTFLRCLNKLEDITGGKVVVDGFDLTDPKVNLDEVRQHIGMVFQHFNLFPHMTVLENIMLAPVELKKLSRPQARNKALELLERVGLSNKADARPAHSSPADRSSVWQSHALWR